MSLASCVTGCNTATFESILCSVSMTNTFQASCYVGPNVLNFLDPLLKCPRISVLPRSSIEVLKNSCSTLPRSPKVTSSADLPLQHLHHDLCRKHLCQLPATISQSAPPDVASNLPSLLNITTSAALHPLSLHQPHFLLPSHTYCLALQ
jgi:hypothetical protein